SCLPESGEGPAVGRVAKLLERPLPDLSNPLPCDSHEKADLLERHRLAAFVETIVQGEDLPLTRREVLLERADDEFAHEVEVGDFLYLVTLTVRESLAERGGIPVAAIDRCIERHFGGADAPRGAYGIRSLIDQAADLFVRRIAIQDLREDGLRASHLDQLRILVQRDADGACLLRECLEYRLSHPPDGVGDELHPLIRIELFHRLEQSLIPDRHELRQL